MWFLPTKPYNAQADLLFLDATSTRRNVDLRVTLASVQPRPTTGTSITIYFTVGQQGPAAHYDASIEHDIDGDSFAVEDRDTNQVADVTGSVDPASDSMLVRVPLHAIGAKYGDVLYGLGVIVAQTFGASQASSGLIEQSTGDGHHYRVGYVNSCRPG